MVDDDEERRLRENAQRMAWTRQRWQEDVQQYRDFGYVGVRIVPSPRNYPCQLKELLVGAYKLDNVPDFPVVELCGSEWSCTCFWLPVLAKDEQPVRWLDPREQLELARASGCRQYDPDLDEVGDDE